MSVLFLCFSKSEKKWSSGIGTSFVPKTFLRTKQTLKGFTFFGFSNRHSHLLWPVMYIFDLSTKSTHKASVSYACPCNLLGCTWSAYSFSPSNGRRDQVKTYLACQRANLYNSGYMHILAQNEIEHTAVHYKIVSAFDHVPGYFQT
jgi:hypothetical protein